MNTLSDFTRYALRELKDFYDEHEIRCICLVIYMDVFNLTKIDIHMKKDDILNETFSLKFRNIISELKTGRPLQYIIGQTEFMSLRFIVNEATLIPRPETGELVRWIASESHQNADILDIGTGSGCIAVSLAHLLPLSTVSAIDISDDAIKTAQKNAVINNVNINTHVRDILHADKYTWTPFDVIVSNPPYIRNSEASAMNRNVLDYEPHSALFVPDDDPLLFYRAIGHFALTNLKHNGLLFLEINEALGNEMIGLLSTLGFSDIELRKDFNNRDRMIRCRISH